MLSIIFSILKPQQTFVQLVFGADHYKFPCPLLMTSIHFLAQWGFSLIACAVAPLSVGSARVATMSWSEWFSTSVPCGIVTSGDVGLSNLAIVSISLTFYTMVKASTPIFVLGWAYLFGIERITPQLIGVVLIIAAGEYLTVVGQAKFEKMGFILCLSASMLSGARWTLVQLKLRSLDPPLKTPFVTMRLLAPSMFCSLFVFSMLIEQPWVKLAELDVKDAASMIGLGLVGAILAILMILCEFYLIMHANAFVLMIGGVVKEMVTIVVGVTFFDDILNRVNMSGCFVVFFGVILYKVSHWAETNKEKSEVDDIDDDKDEIGTSSSHGHFKSPGTPTKKYERLAIDDKDIGFRSDRFGITQQSEGDALMRKPHDGIELRRNPSSNHDSSIGKGKELRRNISHHEGSNNGSNSSTGSSSPIV